MAKKQKTTPIATTLEPKEDAAAAADPSAAGSSDSRNAFLKVFWDLAELNPATRVAAVDAIVAHLTQANDADELSYTLKRLVRGLASSRDAARQGFSTALTALLHHFPDTVSVSDVLTLLLSTMDVSNSMKGMEQREHMFGRLFGLLAIHQSGRADVVAAATLLDELIALSKWKKWFREACYDAVLTVVHSLPSSSFVDVVWPRVEPLLAGAVASFNADQVALAVGVHQYLAQHKLEKTYAKTVVGTIAARHHFAQLVEPLKTSTVSYPRLHSSWRRLLDHLLDSEKLDEERFQEMWSVLVEGMLVAPASTHERRGTALKLFEAIVGRVNGASLRAILTPHFVKCIHNNAASKKTYLHEAATNALATFVAKDAREFFHCWQHHFNHPLTCLVSHLPDDETDKPSSNAASLEALLALEEEKERAEFQAKRIASGRMWALDTMYTAALKLPASTDDAVWTHALQFFVQHAFFTSKKGGKKGAKQEATEPALTPAIQAACGKRVFGLMGLGSQVLKDNAVSLDQSAPFRLWHTWANMPKDVVLRDPLADEAKHKATVNAQLKALRSQLTAATEKKEQLRLKGFILLSVCIGLQLMDPAQREEAASVLVDLERCLAELNGPTKKAKGKKVKKAADDDDEQQPLAVLTDMLLAMLAQDSSVMRDIVNHVFRSIMDQLDSGSIQSMVDVVVAATDDDETAHLQMEEDDDDDGAPIDPSQLTKPSSDDDDDEDKDDEDEETNDDDDEMHVSDLQREDAALSALVGHVAEKKKAKQHAKRLRMAALHFKVRVLDLLHLYAGSQGSHAVAMVEPLFKQWIATKPHSDNVVWSERVSAVLQKIARRKVDAAASTSNAAVAALEAVLSVCATTLLDKKQATVAAALVVYLLRDLKDDADAARAVVVPALTTLLTKKHAKVPRAVFDQVVTSIPAVASALFFDTLATLAIEDKGVDDFSRAEVLRYLTALFKAKVVTPAALATHGQALHKACIDSLGKVKGKRMKGVAACGLALVKARVDAKDETLDVLTMATELKALDATASPVMKGMVAQMLQLLSGNKKTKSSSSPAKRKRAAEASQED
ncbi:Aste57867_10604 [Aphanomyces stellatus]|uniref:Aste57867_10604 protein n=1 Tax=Aphanomyces stellatus TaxID=120398 RepID=A0A485KRH2_9STRA|nr:hypothetical protein As57867_010564 [Aphanomyces stellatus]VFT87476.1 Aste57867_10604 [Aphanomyces stellatus]